MLFCAQCGICHLVVCTMLDMSSCCVHNAGYVILTSLLQISPKNRDKISILRHNVGEHRIINCYEIVRNLSCFKLPGGGKGGMEYLMS